MFTLTDLSCYITKDFNALIGNEPFLDNSVKSRQEAYKNLLKYQGIVIVQHEIY